MFDDFINLQESIAGFGVTEQQAINALFKAQTTAAVKLSSRSDWFEVLIRDGANSFKARRGLSLVELPDWP